jgi:ribonuclease Y
MQEPLLVGAVIALGLAIWFWLKVKVVDRSIGLAERQAENLEKSGAKEGERLKKERLIEAKEEILGWKTQAEEEIQGRRRDLGTLEREVALRKDKLQGREKELTRRESIHRNRADELEAKLEKVSASETRLEAIIQEQIQNLEAVAGMTRDEARKMLVDRMEGEARHDAALIAKRIEEEARESAEIEATKVISQAIQRCAAEHVVETSVSVVDLPSDDMKGRIIGREGRNIRALEQATGVDLIVDDTPEAVILSGFDPLRRQIAKISIEKLIKDGRIHPARIEEVVAKVEQDVTRELTEEGKQTALDLGIHDFHPELVEKLGRLKYRTSYGQNVLFHSREVASLAGVLAREVGADARICIRAGLLHDVGKSVDRELEGTHLQLGVELARKYKESSQVIHAIEAHHFDVPFETVEAVLVQAADAISAARPGARREVLENYVKRLEKLEELTASFDGVLKAFALQAGREVRIIVESSKVTDEQAFWLTKDIAKKIEGELQYPGQIKVTLIREMRVVDYAK